MDAPRSQKLHSQHPTPSDIRAIRQVSERSCRRLGNTHAAGISDFDFDFDFDSDWRLETGDWRLETGDYAISYSPYARANNAQVADTRTDRAAPGPP